MEVLHNGCEEDEELHLSQVFSKTISLSWRREEVEGGSEANCHVTSPYARPAAGFPKEKGLQHCSLKDGSEPLYPLYMEGR